MARMILQLTSLFKAQTSGFGDGLGPQDRPASEYRFPRYSARGASALGFSAAGAEGFSRAMVSRPPKRGMSSMIPARIPGSLPGFRDLARSPHLILGNLSREIG
ncbi:uncharacterized protein BO87DRAFT_401002 [Aspergillus neoniger CBS 115656]|uniref:Uncharacterized protein n=1 Tax=Aspergillus neoniger (strain CBS 115656) TaxID=1448310 RepID=A0A318YBW5_ASPNB|nr:hypothetical protein BO87DRAFT_401002 [Aspergillus neoniger CBS 115656]PYH29843.1 hypothetical protein BO87DRAFT_401002 [Aspergillus neoniger CBS 115656]